jgi:GNAT superfamily N-acetyltransferase
MIRKHLDRYEIDDAPGRLDFPKLEEWLSASYWSPRIKEPEIRKGAANSTLVVGCYLDGKQVGYMRLVSDKVRFAWVMDVYVEEAHRRKGIAEGMMRFSMEHPELLDVYSWMLATKDAHSVYSKVGFGPLDRPENVMGLKKEKVRP